MGIEVGIKGRLLWPGGVLVEDIKHRDYDQAVRGTKALIADPTVPAIFEATMVYDGVLVRVDALERLSDGRWRLNEVKSSTRIKDEHLEDLALQTYVIAGNGLELADAHLVHINDNYIRDKEIDWNGLFSREDVTVAEWEVSVERPAYDLTIFKLHCGRLTLKIYSKGERVLRIEAVAHNTQELNCEICRRPKLHRSVLYRR